MLPMRILVLASTVIGGASVICPLCDTAVSHAAAENTTVAAQVTDTATVRMHISGMTCGTCPVTARIALKKLAGVYDATVTLDDSVGVVRYDPQRVTPAQIATHLTRLTGFKAALLPDSVTPARKTGSR